MSRILAVIGLLVFIVVALGGLFLLQDKAQGCTGSLGEQLDCAVNQALKELPDQAAKGIERAKELPAEAEGVRDTLIEALEVEK